MLGYSELWKEVEVLMDWQFQPHDGRESLFVCLDAVTLGTGPFKKIFSVLKSLFIMDGTGFTYNPDA